MRPDALGLTLPLSMRRSGRARERPAFMSDAPNLRLAGVRMVRKRNSIKSNISSARRSAESQLVAALPLGVLRPVLYYMVLPHPRQYDKAVPVSTSGEGGLTETRQAARAKPLKRMKNEINCRGSNRPSPRHL